MGEYTHACNQMTILSSWSCSARKIKQTSTLETSQQFLPFSTQDQGSAEVGDGLVVKKVCPELSSPGQSYNR